MNPFNFYFMRHMPQPIIVCMLHMNYFDNLKKKIINTATLLRVCNVDVSYLFAG